MQSEIRSVELDNPFWSSLRSRHRDIARRHGRRRAITRREYAPFLGVAHAGVDAAEAIEHARSRQGESVYLLGVAPARMPRGWRWRRFRTWRRWSAMAPIERRRRSGNHRTRTGHRADVLALTALVYPHYFRERTMELGRYFGIYQRRSPRGDDRRAPGHGRDPGDERDLHASGFQRPRLRAPADRMVDQRQPGAQAHCRSCT